MSPVVYLVPYCFWSASQMICSYVRPLMWGGGDICLIIVVTLSVLLFVTNQKLKAAIFLSILQWSLLFFATNLIIQMTW